MTLDAAEIERFRDVVAGRMGLSFDENRLAFLGQVLSRRLEVTSQTSHAYIARLAQGHAQDEQGALARELTVGETYFFRNIDQFHALSQIVLPERVNAQRATRSLRLLSAGCASGEEAYSIAMVVRDHVDPAWDVSVRAVDINPAALERAARARFTNWALRETPEAEYRWFHEQGREWHLDETIRSAVRFEQRNLVADDRELWAPQRYDVVFCRNVIMYFTLEQQHAVISRIARALVPGGYLFLGHAETLRGLSQEFHLCHTHGTFYYQRRSGADSPEWRSEMSQPSRAVAPALSAFLAGDATSWIDAIQRASERIESLSRTPFPDVVTSALAPQPQPPPQPPAAADLRGALDLLRKERFSEALDLVHSLPPSAAKDRDAMILEAVLLTHGGQLERAETVCTELLAIDELNAGAHYALALCREAVGDLRGATDRDQIAIYLDPTFAMPRLHLGLLARRAGDLEAARRELGQALLLLQREDTSRLLLFGGGFGREQLVALCAAELEGART